MAVLPETGRIILIEADPHIRQQVEAILARGPYTLLSFADRREALPALRLRQHDAVIAGLEWPAPSNASAIRRGETALWVNANVGVRSPGSSTP